MPFVRSLHLAICLRTAGPCPEPLSVRGRFRFKEGLFIWNHGGKQSARVSQHRLKPSFGKENGKHMARTFQEFAGWCGKQDPGRAGSRRALVRTRLQSPGALAFRTEVSAWSECMETLFLGFSESSRQLNFQHNHALCYPYPGRQVVFVS